VRVSHEVRESRVANGNRHNVVLLCPQSLQRTRRKQSEVDYLTAENRVLREKLGGLKLRLTDAESPSALEKPIERPHLAGT
jgi:hypothetical protein